MTVSKSTTAAAILAFVVAAPLVAQPKESQQPAPKTAAAAPAPGTMDGGTPHYIKPETPEERKIRLGTTEDPGLDPDPKKIYHRFGRDYHIDKDSRQYEAYDRVPEGWVRPNVLVNVGFELYQRNDKYLWYWVPEDLRGDSAARDAAKLTQAQRKFLESFRPEFSVLDAPDSSKTLRFEESSEGLPTAGSWRNSLAVADMNGDGFVDLVAPPQRGANNGLPVIFLGDGKGHWRLWTGLHYPESIDYGSVVAADFNKDGKMDLAFAVHLSGVHAWLGDGKGTFVAANKGLPLTTFPTRKVVAADLDHDGAVDLLAVSEGATRGGVVGGGRVRAFFNRKKGTEWEELAAVGAEATFAGDSLVVGNFNGDRYPDFAGGNVFFQSADLMWLSDGPKKWKLAKTDGVLVPTLTSYAAATVGHFISKKLDDVVFTYGRAWPESTSKEFPPPDMKAVGGLDLLTFANGELKRKPIVRFANPTRGIVGIGTGDFDGDGNDDIAYLGWTPKREFVILLGDGKGNFTRAHLDGLTAEPQTNYDLAIADVNGDGRPDLIVMYESDKQGSFGVQNGSIHVFLNRGVTNAGAAKK
jgi:hypothetical protein